jgi:hypothetical protein
VLISRSHCRVCPMDGGYPHTRARVSNPIQRRIQNCRRCLRLWGTSARACVYPNLEMVNLALREGKHAPPLQSFTFTSSATSDIPRMIFKQRIDRLILLFCNRHHAALPTTRDQEEHNAPTASRSSLSHRPLTRMKTVGFVFTGCLLSTVGGGILGGEIGR